MQDTAPEHDPKLSSGPHSVEDRDDSDGKCHSPPKNSQDSPGMTSPKVFPQDKSRDGKRKRQQSRSPEPGGSPEAGTRPSTPGIRSKRPRTSTPAASNEDARPYGLRFRASAQHAVADRQSGNTWSTSSAGEPCAGLNLRPAAIDETFRGPPTSADPSLGTDNILSALNPAKSSSALIEATGDSTSPCSHPLSTASPSTGDHHSKAPPPFHFWQALLQEEDLTRYVATWMDVADLVKLYCISKRFHWILNKKYTSTIVGSARIHAPIAMEIFPYQAYRRLCIRDPMRLPMPRRPTEMRMVPGLKWLQMIAYRTLIVHDILLAMSMEGHRFLEYVATVLMKIWFLLDIPYTGVRIGIIHNPKYWKACDLWFANQFFVKLDMRFSDPISGSGCSYLRSLMMGQRSLTILWLVLRGKVLTSRLELLQMMVEFDYAPIDGNPERLPIMDVPSNKVGGLSCEAWTAGNMRLLRPDELVLKEATRRGMALHRYFCQMLMASYIDWETYQAIPLPDFATLKL